MKTLSIKHYALSIILALSLPASAQEKQVHTLTLEQVIRMAQEKSPSAVSARLNRESAEWSYRFYKANYLPSVTLTSNPSYARSINKITQPDGTFKYLEQNSLSTDLNLSIQQNIALTGGTFSITSSLDRSDFFREGQDRETSYSSRPIYIGYSQSLFGLNSLKWDRRIEPIAYREACKRYNETMELVASNACSYFFNLAAAQVNAEIANFNYASADTLYRYAQGRYGIGTITENEMLQLEINKLSEEANRIEAQFAVEDNMQALRSFLALQDNVEIRVVPDDSVPHFTVSADKALAMAYEHNPDPEYFKRTRLQSDRNVANAKANAGLRANIYLQFGLTQTGPDVQSAYRDPINSQTASVTLSLPILDWGRGRGQVKMARSNRELTYLNINQSERDFQENVFRIVRQFNQQAAKMNIVAKTDITAERRFEVARRLYLMGKSSILDLNSATSEKDAARRNHISALRNYWSLYYTLRSLTGYDFERGKEIEWEKYRPPPDLPLGGGNWMRDERLRIDTTPLALWRGIGGEALLKNNKQKNMDIQLKKRPWYIRYKYYLMAGAAFMAFMIYVVFLSMGPRKQRIDTDSIQIADVETNRFMEYVDVEGLVQPILTIQVNTKEGGSVERIVAEEGALLQKGDTILTLVNPELTRSINDRRDEYEKQLVSYRNQEINMEKQTLNLRQQILQARYEQKRLKKNYELAKEEYAMGIKSKAELEVVEEEYNFKTQTAALQMESLKHDSVASALSRQMLQADRERERKKFDREMERQNDLVVRAPISGQLSYLQATPGQQVGGNSRIGEIKVLDQYKIHTSLSEYYIDRVTNGLPATIIYQGKRFPLKITKVVPEVKERSFDVDLVFADKMPDNVRVGKSYRVQIELGQPEEAVVIPRGNFYQATGGQWIYKVNEAGDRAFRTAITIGRQNPQQYEVTAGLKPGDRVITTGYDQFGDAEVLVLEGE